MTDKTSSVARIFIGVMFVGIIYLLIAAYHHLISPLPELPYTRPFIPSILTHILSIALACLPIIFAACFSKNVKNTDNYEILPAIPFLCLCFLLWLPLPYMLVSTTSEKITFSLGAPYSDKITVEGLEKIPGGFRSIKFFYQGCFFNKGNYRVIGKNLPFLYSCFDVTDDEAAVLSAGSVIAYQGKETILGKSVESYRLN